MSKLVINKSAQHRKFATKLQQVTSSLYDLSTDKSVYN